MKIITPGKLEKETYWWLNRRFQCQNCKCIFEMEYGDCRTNEKSIKILCPFCKYGLRISKPLSDSELSRQKSIFGELFGHGGTFEDIFGKTKL
jgi:hypothetical protein